MAMGQQEPAVYRAWRFAFGIGELARAFSTARFRCWQVDGPAPTSAGRRFRRMFRDRFREMVRPQLAGARQVVVQRGFGSKSFGSKSY